MIRHADTLILFSILFCHAAFRFFASYFRLLFSLLPFSIAAISLFRPLHFLMSVDACHLLTIYLAPCLFSSFFFFFFFHC